MDVNEIIVWVLGGGGVFLVLLIVSTLLCTILPTAGIVWFLYKRRQKAVLVQQNSQTWLTTTGRILKSRVEVSGGELTSVFARVIYEYQVNGRQYQGDQIRAGDKFWGARTSKEAYQTIDRYPEGADVTVFYNPKNPAEAALER